MSLTFSNASAVQTLGTIKQGLGVTDLLKQFRGASGLSLGHAIVDDLGARILPASPANYEIWAAYKAKTHPDLCRDIELRLAAGRALTEDALAELYELHFAKTRLSAQIVEASAEVSREIAEVAASLRDAGALTGAYAGELDGLAANLESPVDLMALRATVSQMARATKDMVAHNLNLEAKLQTSSRQLDSLQTTLQDIRLQAVTDGLTGLANRRQFDEVLAAELARISGAQDLCLLLMDIDHFKRVNDTWGHQVGDQVIRFVASVIKAYAGSNVAARYGGEEFALILPGRTLREAYDIAEQIRTTVRAKRLSKRTSGDVIGIVTISAGIAAFRPGERSADLIRRADNCLYRSKHGGRDRTTCAMPAAAAA